jgi:hypothetical protein
MNVSALEGRSIPLAVRGSIRILRVDDRGVLRETSQGHIGLMHIDSFRWTVSELDRRGVLTRAEILDGIRRWESSGVVATLAATGRYEVVHDPTVGLRLKAGAS